MNTPFRLIMGRNCITEVLRASPERIVEVYTCQKPGEDSLYEQLLKQRILVSARFKNQLTHMVESESHQSYVAAVKERIYPSSKEFLEQSKLKEHSLVLMLDSIYDPQNLGAILRAAECFGVDLVIYSKNRGADITPTVTKTSAGASELVPICKVSNLADTLQAFQKSGYWAVSAAIGEKSQSLYQLQYPEKTLLIVGSEGKGIQPLLTKKSDFHVMIPMLGQIDSLNVAQATAIMLNGYRTYFA